MQSEGFIHDITKEYKEMYKVIVYKTPFDRMALSNANKSKDKKKIKLKLNNSSESSIQRSVRRSRTAIADYTMCNDFDLFVTFTFNPKKVNRYDLGTTYLKMQGWLHRQQRKYPNFRYVCVPEKHKDGAIHFHALINGYEGNLRKTAVIQNERLVYNVTGFTFGFTNAQYMDGDMKKATAYLCKYITKDMAMIHGRRRYWASKNLRKPVKYVNEAYELNLMHRLDYSNVVHETDFNVIYEVPKAVVGLFE